MRTTRDRGGPQGRLAPLMRHGFTLSAILLAALVVGCSSAPTTAPLRPTATMIPTPSPTATIPGITQLSLPIAGAAVPSPDGTMVAGGDPQPKTVTIYSLQGQVLAQATAPANDVYSYSWLPDSSGLLIWLTAEPGNSGALSILSPKGAIQPTGLPSRSIAPSPDGAWLAALAYDGSNSSPSSIEVAPRHGGAVHTLASDVGVALLGWQGTDVAFASNGNIFVIAPTGGAARLLASEHGVEWGPTDPAPTMSPDGQVLILFERQHGFARLVGSQVLKFPAGIVQPPIIWTGPHQGIGLTGSDDATVEAEVKIVDLVSGAVIQDTGTKAPLSVEALSGDWLGAWAQPENGGPTLHFTNLQTKHEVDLGTPPTGGEGFGGEFGSLGGGKFFLHGDGQSYLLDPTAPGVA